MWHAEEDNQNESVTPVPGNFGPGTQDLANCLAVIRQGGPPSISTIQALEQEQRTNLRNTASLLARVQQGVPPGTA